jgi:mannose-6-phosphate isomerase-like protein (cupin superfamily)
MMLDGGVRVTGLKDGEPVREGALRIWNHFGGDAVSLRVLELDGTATLRNETEEEVLYVLERDIAIHLPAGASYTLDARMTLISVRTPATSASGPPVVVSLEERPLQRTGDRWYRELITSEVTQFVGVIPPGRAPDHYHLYEEVLCILDGEGAMWAGPSSAPITTGSCIYLPRGQTHCVENRGDGDLRLLGVFYPAGSPAVRYS